MECSLLLNLKSGPDGFTKADLTWEVETMSDILTAVSQYSIDIGELPSSWKLADVVPIFKAEKLLACITFMKVIRTYCIT